jgi:translation initiation factor IF-2
MEEKVVGKVTNFFNKIMVAGIDITDGKVKMGDRIRIKGSTTDFEMTIESMQIDREPVQEAVAGQSIGVKVPSDIRVGDSVYLIGG